MKRLPLLKLNIDDYQRYNHPPTKKEGGRMAIITRDVISELDGRVLLKKGTKGSVIPLGNFGLLCLFNSYNDWFKHNWRFSYCRIERSYDFFHTFRKDGKDIVGTWHTHISREHFQYTDSVQLGLFN